MIRRITTLALALSLLAAGATWASAAPAPRDLTLRLTDFQPGYSPVASRDDHAPIADVAPGTGHACEMDFWRFWTAPGARPGPAIVMSAVLVLPSAERAAAVLGDPLQVASRALVDLGRPTRIKPIPGIGDQAFLLRGADGGAAILWRSGPVLASLLAAAALDGRRTVDAQAAIDLATIQQAHIATPTPLQPGDNDGSEVALDDPGLDMPIWWLGRTLPQRGRLPELKLGWSIPSNLFGDGSAAGLMLIYGDHRTRGQITLSLVRRRFLHRPAVQRDLRHLRRDRCYLRRRITLRDGRATIFQRSPRCPKLDVRETADAFDDTTAVVVLPGVVAFVAADGCVNCHGPVSRYESIAGMRRIVRALQPRPAPSAITP